MHRRTHLPWAALALLGACAGSPPAPTPAEAPTGHSPAPETPAPEALAPEAPARFEPAEPDGWMVEKTTLGDRRWVLALAYAPDEGRVAPPGRLTVSQGGRIVAQRSIDAVLDPPEGESWFPLIGTVDAGERTLVRVSVRGVTGEDYKEIVDQSALLLADRSSLDPVWRGSGGTAQGMMGRCFVDETLELRATGATLSLRTVSEARWLGGPPEEDWEREIQRECTAGAASKPIDVALPPPR